jgi:hypothetical protein
MRRNRPASAPFLRSACVLGDEQTSTYLNATLRGLHESMRNLDLSRPLANNPARGLRPVRKQAPARGEAKVASSLVARRGCLDRMSTRQAPAYRSSPGAVSRTSRLPCHHPRRRLLLPRSQPTVPLLQADPVGAVVLIARQVRSLGRQNGVGLLLQHELRIQVAAIGEVTALLEDDMKNDTSAHSRPERPHRRSRFSEHW